MSVPKVVPRKNTTDKKNAFLRSFCCFYGRKNQKWIDNILNGRIKVLPDDETVQCAAEKGEERNSERQGETVSENFK